jgi:hypothetical protein
MLVSWSAYSSTLKMEAICSSETSVDSQRIYCVVSTNMVLFVLFLVRCFPSILRTWRWRQYLFRNVNLYSGIIIGLLDIIHHPVFSLKQRFGDWILSPSSNRNLLRWAQSLSPDTRSGIYTKHNTIHQRELRPTLQNSTYMRSSSYGHASFEGQSP